MLVGDRERRRAAAPRVPLLRAQEASGLPPAAFGLAFGAFNLLLLMLPTLDSSVSPAQRYDMLAGALFFACSFAIVAGFTAPIFLGAAADLRALGRVLPLSDEDRETLAQGLTRMENRHSLLLLATGLTAGLGHAHLLGQWYLPLPFMLSQVFATVLLWLVMFLTLPKLIANALLFSRLGAAANPDILCPAHHAPFGAAALRPALFVIGILCAYGLLFFGERSPLNSGVLIGMGLSLASLFGILALPLRGIRRRIRQRREAMLEMFDERLSGLDSTEVEQQSAAQLRDLDTLLTMRARVSQAPTWPLDLAGLRRILLYIVLPPLTWAAAAFVELLIDGLL